MTSSEARYPSLARRLYSVWYRHMRVYARDLVSNGLPPFLEPIIFLLGIGFGLGKYVTGMQGLPYVVFLATAMPMTSAMFTASYECTFGTFVRLEFSKTYEGMLAAPLTVTDLFAGELLWAGSKGFFFAACVIAAMTAFGVAPMPGSLFAPFVGALTALAFGALSLLVTSFVKNINHFNFYFTGLLSPMFFFCGAVFPLAELPPALRYASELLPLTHSVRLARALAIRDFAGASVWDAAFLIVFSVAVGALAIARLKRRIIV
ncbi:MAG TPA: ABC transporter permease [Polyangiaceae bacterium]|nr:ABC transporter permease [Polyangiaceae bacterium]